MTDDESGDDKDDEPAHVNEVKLKGIDLHEAGEVNLELEIDSRDKVLMRFEIFEEEPFIDGILACLLVVVRRCRRRRCAFKSEDDCVPGGGCVDRKRMRRPCHTWCTEDRCWLRLL